MFNNAGCKYFGYNFQDYYNDDYLDVPLVKPSDYHSYQMEMPDGILKLNKEYTAYPLVRLFNHFEAIAPPAAIIGLYAYPYTDEEGSVTSSSAVVYGHLLDENHICGNAIVGFLYGKSSDLIHTGNRVVCHMDGNRKFQLGLNNLEDGTRYYYQAFMEFKDSIYYGEVKSFETPEIPDDAVDLGLSVLWAVCMDGLTQVARIPPTMLWAMTAILGCRPCMAAQALSQISVEHHTT